MCRLSPRLPFHPLEQVHPFSVRMRLRGSFLVHNRNARPTAGRLFLLFQYIKFVELYRNFGIVDKLFPFRQLRKFVDLK